jgi:hypothetical protein
MNPLQRWTRSAGAVLALLVATAGSAQAVVAAGGPAPKAAAVRESRPTRSGMVAADDSAALREGVITALSADGHRVEVQGNWLRVVAGRTRFFQRGTEVTARQLQKGSKVKFTLAPGETDHATLGVVYVP